MESSKRKRIQVYTDKDLKRRVELAASKRNMAVTEYCLSAVIQQLKEDDVLERETVTIPIKVEKGSTDDLISKIRALRKEIKKSSGLLDTKEALEEARKGRLNEFTSLY